MLRHTKTLRMVGLVAQAIMRRRDRDSLLDEICRVATQEVFCMAWIGMLDHDRHWLVCGRFLLWRTGIHKHRCGAQQKHTADRNLSHLLTPMAFSRLATAMR